MSATDCIKMTDFENIVEQMFVLLVFVLKVICLFTIFIQTIQLLDIIYHVQFTVYRHYAMEIIAVTVYIWSLLFRFEFKIIDLILYALYIYIQHRLCRTIRDQNRIVLVYETDTDSD